MGFIRGDRSLRGRPELSADQHERAHAWLARLAKLFARGRSEGHEDRSIEELILGGPRRYTWAELLAETELDPRLATRLWLSMGFAEVDQDEVAFTEADFDALHLFEQARASGLLPADIQVAATRAVGQAMSGLADWQVEMLYQMVPTGPTDIDEDQVQDTADRLLPLVERIQTYVWRRHLAAAAGRIMTAGPEESTRTLVVGFADMVEYTHTTRQLGAFELIELVDGFQAVAAELVANQHGRVVKTVGDEVLFVTSQPAGAAEIALGLIEQLGGVKTPPELRIGMACGPVLTRFGDVYGEIVNIASRLTTHAKPGEILIDEHLAEELEDHHVYRIRRRHPLRVREYRHLPTWNLTRAASAPTV